MITSLHINSIINNNLVDNNDRFNDLNLFND